MKSFAQNFEDVMLWRALGHIEDGFFIDIGAHHPVKDSVSKCFSDSGWTGIHVEPVPFYADLIRQDRPRDKVIEAIVSDKNGLFEFYNIEGTGLSTSSKEIAEGHKSKNFDYSSIIVNAITLDDIISLCPDREIHWLKIDVEGMEKAVLSGWTDGAKRPWVVVIESTYPGTQISNFSDWEYLIVKKGYSHVYSDGLNRFYIHFSKNELNDYFKCPPNIFDGFQLAPESDHVIEIVRAHDQKIAAMESYIAAHEKALQIRTDEIVAAVRCEAREQLHAGLEREQAVTQAATVQQQEWEQRCAGLQEQIEAARENFLAREQNLQARTDEIISDVRAKARERLEAAREREQALAQVMATQQESYGSAIAALTKSYQDHCDQMQMQINEYSERFKNIESKLKKAKNKINCKENSINYLLSVIERQRILFDVISQSRSWKLSNVIRFFLKEKFLEHKISYIKEDTCTSRIGKLIEISNKTHVPICDLYGPEGGNQIAVFSKSEKLQGHEKLKYQGCTLHMSFPDVSNIIDLISLPLDQFITVSYKLLLGRNPEQSELRLHSSALRAGLGRSRMLFEIYSSPEYKSRYNEIISTKSDDEFIGWLYHRYMHRSPDPTGLVHYSAMLCRGVSREQIKKDVATSSEAQSTGGLWIELDRLLAFERQQHRRARRWFRRYRPGNRQQRQEQEALLQLFHTTGGRPLKISQAEHGQLGQVGAAAASALGSDVAEPIFPLAAVDTSDMGPEARRIISRLQHVKGASSLEKGHA